MTTSKKVLALLMIIALILSPFSGAFADDEAHITLTSNVPTTTVNVAAGQQYSLDLTTCFNEPNSTHTLTYSLTGNNLGPHTKIAANIHNSNHQTFFFSEQNEGDYLVTITATCSDGDSASFDVYFKVTSGVPASSAQTNYDETNASSVTVYVTVSNDGMPIRGNDGTQSNNGTVLACYPVTISYFDLALYDLEDFYRYPAAGGSNVIQRPTLLHLYIYLLERYYMGLDAADCLNGTDDYDVMNYHTDTCVYYMDGSLAYSSGTSNYAIIPTGVATSFYMTNFWGHDENLMYFRNHVYPLMSDGWGATADYILLSDGDYIDIAMYSNWNFMGSGAFLCFNSDAFVTIASNNTSRTYNTMMFPTSAAFGLGGSITAITEPLDVDIYNDSWVKIADLTHEANSNAYSYVFSTAGTYYIVAKDIYAKSSSACYAPAVAKITVNSAN